MGNIPKVLYRHHHHHQFLTNDTKITEILCIYFNGPFKAAADLHVLQIRIEKLLMKLLLLNVLWCGRQSPEAFTVSKN